MSFDRTLSRTANVGNVSIPFEQGDVFRRSTATAITASIGLNPFRTGRCLSTKEKTKWLLYLCLNPFRTGRCLSTLGGFYGYFDFEVSIPFEQGDVFRRWRLRKLRYRMGLNPFRTGRCLSTKKLKERGVYGYTSQSLSNRAMSFDEPYP